MPPSPQDIALWNILDISLKKYPNLYSLAPVGWPSDPKFDITSEKLKFYMKSRRGTYVINLPLILYNLQFGTHKRVPQLFSSIMGNLDLFCIKFVIPGVPGADKIVKPIWTDNWNLQDSRFFAVIVEIYFSFFLEGRGRPIKEFEKLYNPPISQKSADVVFDQTGTDVYLDIKSPKMLKWIWCNWQLRRSVEQTAMHQINNELKDLQPKCFGVVALIYRPLGRTGRWFKYKNKALDIVKHPTDIAKFAHVYWVKPVLTIHGRDLVVFDNTVDFSKFLVRPWRRRLYLTFLARIEEIKFRILRK